MSTSDRADIQAQFSILNSQFYIRLVRWAFARFYREFAWTYDTVAAAVSGGRWAAWGRACLPYLDGRVLEIGCGTGNLQVALARRPGAPPAFGLDASPQMLALSARKLARAKLPPRLTRAGAQALPFAPSSFESIVATFPTDYILEHTTLAEIGRVLRPGGHLVVALAASFGSSSPYARAIDLLYRATLQRSPAAPPDAAPRSALGQALSRHGFAVEERWELAGSDRVHLIICERV
jgi:ubiquinone/menaquinone biosynthesis C-methylase UbiE